MHKVILNGIVRLITLSLCLALPVDLFEGSHVVSEIGVELAVLGFLLLVLDFSARLPCFDLGDGGPGMLSWGLEHGFEVLHVTSLEVSCKV